MWLDLANLPDHLTQHPPVHDPLETCHDAAEYQSQPSDLRFHLDNLPCKPLLLPHHITLCKGQFTHLRMLLVNEFLDFYSFVFFINPKPKNLETKIVK